MSRCASSSTVSAGSASTRSCVAITTQCPAARSSSTMRATALRPCASRPAVGSSRRTTSARRASTCARWTLCCCPPDNACIGLLRNWVTPIRSIASSTAVRSSGPGRPRRPSEAKRPMRTTSEARNGSVPRDFGCCGRYATDADREPGHSPSTRQSPETGSSSPASVRRIVLLPEPFVPIRTTSSPWPTDRLMQSTTTWRSNPTARSSVSMSAISDRALNDRDRGEDVRRGTDEPTRSHSTHRAGEESPRTEQRQ